ncbi:M56 family metallopeptidase [Diaminobutyricimonas sp. LJ205]|uniref:M56 family metallopeptidase n=1 Tax=Diaminobutyricimonas sp. LJ205 TaxID=2683590 RepID=UPI0012F480B9|nr:M56 family metallopeptidase [Diaminobutyricimonas sp. LJ205]
MTGFWLAALALLLAGPVTDAFGRARWTDRAPRAAVVLWQAIAIAAVLAAIGSVLALPEELLRLTASQDELQFGPDLVAAATIAAIMAGTIVLRLIISLGRLAISTRRRRQRHRDLVDLISQADATRQALDLRILDGEHPIAYCVPGREARVVISTGTTALLSTEQVDAVVAHERAHLRSRHDLVIEAFTALHAAFPRWVRSRLALDSVRTLLEMLADDNAARLHGRGVVASAITAMTAADDTEATARIRRLEVSTPTAVTQPRRRLAAAMYAGAAAVLLIPTVSLAMPWLTDAYAALPL